MIYTKLQNIKNKIFFRIVPQKSADYWRDAFSSKINKA